MNKDIIKGHWHEAKGKLKQKWGMLTDDDIARMEGTFEELEGTLQKRYGYSKEKATEEIKGFLRANKWEDKTH